MPAGAIPFPFGDCRVCADKATGVHYGVATCEGCKGFFKRSIPKADKYRCFYQGQCTLNPQERNRCKSCRFRRCLEVGMSVDGVKMGRIPKLEKEKALEEHRKELEQKSADVHGVAGQLREDVVSLARGSVCEQHSPLPSDEISGPVSPNLLQLETSKDKVTGNRCSSTDSGIDDGVRLFSKKSKSLNKCWPNFNDAFEFGEARSDEAYAGVFNIGAESHCLHGDLTKVLRKREASAAAKFPNFGESDRFDLDSHEAPISDGCNPSPSGCQTDETHLKTLYSAFGTESDEAINIKQASRSSSSFGNDIVMPADKVLSASTSQSGLPFYPTVIKELLNQVIETGHAKELQHNLVRQFLSASKSADWRPEMWLRCLSNSQAVSGESATAQGFFGACPLGSLDRSQPQTFKRKTTSEVDEGSGLRKGVKRIGQSFSCQREAFDMENQVVDSRVLSFSDLSKVTEKCDSYNTKSAERHMKGIMKNEDKDVTNLKKPPRSETLEADEVKKGPTAADMCSQDLRKTNLFAAVKSDSENVVKAEDNIPGSECPERLQRMKKIEAMASMVPLLTFWDIPENTLGSSSATPPVPGTELEQCKREIEQVLEWLKVVGHRFTEKSRLDFSVWDEEVVGLRPVHPLNLLTSLTQKDIGIFWEEVVGCVPLCNFLILGLCSSVPGFSQLDQEDRGVLMEAAYFDVWIILLSSLFRDGDCFLRLVCEARYSRFWMQVFMPEKLVNGMFHFAEELNSCNLTPCERIILCAIQLTSKEHERMKNPTRVQQLHDYYLDLLAYQIEHTHKSNHSRVLIKIFQLLPMLTPISRESLELTSMLRVDQPPEVTSHIKTSAERSSREPAA